MSRAILLAILFSVTLTAFAQIVLKAGMTRPAVQDALATRAGLHWIARLALEPLVVLGLLIYFAAALVWLLVLSKTDVGLAYPFVALGFVLTALMGRAFFGESLSLVQMGGIAIICAGVLLLARG